jgi:hypothetical protein
MTFYARFEETYSKNRTEEKMAARTWQEAVTEAEEYVEAQWTQERAILTLISITAEE